MGFQLKHFTPVEQRAFIATHDLAKPKEWAVMDDGMVYRFCDTREEATEFLKSLRAEEAITERFEAWVEDTATQLGTDEATIKQIILHYL